MCGQRREGMIAITRLMSQFDASSIVRVSRRNMQGEFDVMTDPVAPYSRNGQTTADRTWFHIPLLHN